MNLQLKSRGLHVELASLAQIPPFSPTGVALANVAKTGLGSSAALITSLVTALLIHTGLIAPDQLASASSRHFAHNVAQFVHCLAQGKVGSGFDVSAAVFGSQLYTRFSPSVLQPLMDDPVCLPLPCHPNSGFCLSFPQTGSHSLLSVLAPENQAWDLTVKPFALPPRTRLLLADIHAGSNTPLLVSKVLKWRSENSAVGMLNHLSDLPCAYCITAHSLWTSLDQCNTSLGQTLMRLTQLYEKDEHAYVETVRWVSGLQPMQVRIRSLASISAITAFAITHQYSAVARKPQYATRASDVPQSVLRSTSSHRGNPDACLGSHVIISLNSCTHSKSAAKCVRWESCRASRSSPRSRPSFSMRAYRWQASSEVAFPAVRIPNPL